MAAAQYSPNPEAITILLNLGADPNAKDRKGNMAVDHVGGNEKLKNTDVLSILSTVTDFPKTDSILGAMSDSDFIELCKGGSLRRINETIEAGANVNAVDENGMTPLMFAAGANSDPEVAKALIDAGAYVNASGIGGGTPLMSAALINSNPEVITILVNAGADIEAKTTDGETALIAAAMKCQNPEVITILLNLGADPNVKDNSGKKAIDYAKDNEKLKNTDAFWALNDASF
jgi:ankyrin repeat protein